MDSFFGVGGPELLLVLVLALVALGPLRMLQAARSFGRLLRDLRRYYNDLMAGIHKELSEMDAPQDLRQRTVAVPPKPDRPQPVPPPPEPVARAAPNPTDRDAP